MSLPEKWIDRIFEKLSVTYGQAFMGRWSGVSMADVKADWAHELRGFSSRPDALAYALTNLPPQPPNVVEFRALCNRMPEQPQPGVTLLPSPDGMRRMKQALQPLSRMSGITFAELLSRHRARRDAGQQTAAQKDWLKTVEEGMGGHIIDAAVDSITLVPQSVLPPGMRE